MLKVTPATADTIPTNHPSPNQDEWLFGWDSTPGIVSVWANRRGQALVWRRIKVSVGSGQTQHQEQQQTQPQQVVCHKESFRPWLFASTLADLSQLGSNLYQSSSLAQAHQDNLPFSFQKLANSSIPATNLSSSINSNSSPSPNSNLQSNLNYNSNPNANSFCYLLSASDGQTLERELIKGARKRLGKDISSLRDLGEEYYRVGPVEQYLMATGRAYFRDMVYSDLHRLQFDLETTALDPKQGRIFLVAIHDSKGFSALLEAPSPKDEPELIQKLCQIVRERDPDVIENHNLFGFDLPFLEERARVLRVPLIMARQEGPPQLEHYQEPQAYRRSKRVRYNLAGRELIDTLDAVVRHDFSARDMSGHGLKAAARYFGVAAPQRTYIPGAKIYQTYQSDPHQVRRYALDDVLEVDGLSQRLMAAPFALAGIAPRPFGRLASAGPAMGILEPMLVRAYLRAGEALPAYPFQGGSGGEEEGEGEGELGPHAGGATILYSAGVARQVVKADVASMYPSIMRTFQIGPRSDRLGVLLFLVSRLTDLRLQHKQALKNSIAASPEAYHHLAMHSAMKILINSGYGYMGAGSMALFADRKAADEVTRQGREILGQVAQALSQKGMILLEADTDGIFFALPPQFEDWGETEERALVTEVGSKLAAGIKLEYEGRYRAMLSHEVKNYALLSYDGKLIIRGVAFRSSRSEPFGVKFLQKAVECCLTGDTPGLYQCYQETVTALVQHQLNRVEVATVARLAKSAEQYLKSRHRLREASYEAVLATGRTGWRVGERVRFYRSIDGRFIIVPEEDEDGDQAGNQKEEQTHNYEDSEPGQKLVVGASKVAEATKSKSKVELTTKPIPAAPVEGTTGKLARIKTLELPRYDVQHYLRVLQVSYVSRLRKAFSPADFEQLFRLNGQSGLFDRPIAEIQPQWIS